MINLMYIVLTAMLALNVSSDVLNGFTDVHRGVSASNANASSRNAAILASLSEAAARNPEKAGLAYAHAMSVARATDSLFSVIDSLKLLIVREADGPHGRVDSIEAREDLEAASVVMLSPINGGGPALRKAVDSYRDLVSPLIADSARRALVSSSLSTRPSSGQSWEGERFDNQPVIAAVTILSQLQGDILQAEGVTLSDILDGVDAGDLRVNAIDAFVLPSSRLVMRGSEYTADILLAAVDTTSRPAIVVDGHPLPAGSSTYSVSAGAPGVHEYSGYLEVSHHDGTSSRHPFSSSYTVIEPMATVSATMMNVLYAGIDNPLSISVPGVPSGSISASMTGGTLTRSGSGWVARPSKPGSDATINVTADVNGRRIQVADMKFRVRRLPDPTPYITVADAQGAAVQYRGGRPLARATLLAAPGISAAIDDGVLNIPFTVNSFETVFFDSMGNAMTEVSDGPNFSRRQRDAIKRLSRGKRFYISRVQATGPDGSTRTLSPLEVIVN